jgi:hypothetical protein
MMQRCVTVVVSRIEVSIKFLDQIPNDLQPSIWSVSVGITGEPSAIPHPGCGVDREYTRVALLDRRQT